MSKPMRCYQDGWHPAHAYTYGGQPAHCDGLNTGQVGDDEPGQCCADPLCPCATKPGWGAYGFRRRRDQAHPHDTYDDEGDE